jgi:hypothetical protein
MDRFAAALAQGRGLSWFDWTLVERRPEGSRFTKRVIAFRANRHLSVGRSDMTRLPLGPAPRAVLDVPVPVPPPCDPIGHRTRGHRPPLTG